MRCMSLSTATLDERTLDDFWNALQPATRTLLGRDELATELAAAARQIAAAWPDIDDVPALLVRVAPRIAVETSAPACVLSSLAWSDLALADACLRQVPSALAAFEAGHGDALAAALVAANIDADARSEALQRLRLRLLVHEDGAPRLAGYAGRGPLRTWLRVAALREALMLARASRRRAAHEVTDEDALLEHAAVAEDPELLLLQGRCREALRDAFAGAVASLDSRERTLLRLSLRDRLSVDQIGALYRVHRSTAARWLQAVRDKLSASTRAALASKLSLADAEVESLIRAIGSRIDLSLGSIAAASPPT